MREGDYKKYRLQRSLGKRAIKRLAALKSQAANPAATVNESAFGFTADSSSVSAPASTFVSSGAGILELSANGSHAASDSHPDSLGGYRILKELGQSDMGAVYLAKQNSLNRQVAIKTIRPQLASKPAFISRFIREAYAAAQLTHYNVLQVYDLAEDHGTHFFSMEYVEGVTLDKSS